MRDILNVGVSENFKILENLCNSCGWVWWHENVLAISDRPLEIHRDSTGRLHGKNSAAIVYRDGWKLYFHHGLSIHREIIENPELITIQKIEKEKNSEIRRVMIEKYGQSRYILDSGSEVISIDEIGILYKREIEGDEPILMVRVLNGTPEPNGSLSKKEAEKVFGKDQVLKRLKTMELCGVRVDENPRFKEYMLRVPPEMKTAREAVAWTFGKSEKDYNPIIET